MKERILEVLGGVIHPAEGRDIVSLGMVENVHANASSIKFTLVFPRRDPLSGSIKNACKEVLEAAFPGYDISILELVRAGKKPEKVAVNPDLENLANVGSVIAVASGKGGVGKSMVAVNLAITLARKGYKVGVADADIYGPSIPKMTGTENVQPEAEIDGEKQTLIPVEKYGVKWMSIGYFARPEQALVWRGPLASNALKQMILQVAWGELDYLLIDLPPGTGDIQISLVNDVPLDGVFVVTTPQKVALADVEKSIDMFINPKVNKHIFGIIENMSWFTPEEYPDHKYYIFGRGGAEALAEKYNLPLLAQIPLVASISSDSDSGTPAALHDGPVFDALSEIF
ncbi:MAG: Mrp/NBP35 family ATP-binding protein [Bacteroidales bacterium]|nr:Mrp/NBP35 family ATP-binding protein [Bacteroidales bacterium]MBQ9528899.1 Mrp/NBP35 family ATP-binding protein [Bacteroidales bacterium]